MHESHSDTIERLQLAEIDRLRSSNVDQAAEIGRLLELVRGIGANRYWEGRWRDEKVENEKLRAALQPFAEVPPGSHGPGERMLIVRAGTGPYHILEGDLMRAKAALAGEQSPGETK